MIIRTDVEELAENLAVASKRGYNVTFGVGDGKVTSFTIMRQVEVDINGKPVKAIQ